LTELGRVGASGFRPEDLAQIRQIEDATNRENQARIQSIQQSMQARGQGGSGAELAASLQASQSAANRAAQQGLDVSGQASKRALEAIMQGGTLGGQLREQDYKVASDRARAQEELNRFNVEADMSRQQRTVGSRNRAAEMDWENRQAIANKNIGMRNQETLRQSDARRQKWIDDMDRAKALSGQFQKQSDYQNAKADSTAKQWAGIGQSVGQGLTSYFTDKPTQTKTLSKTPTYSDADIEREFDNYTSTKTTRQPSYYTPSQMDDDISAVEDEVYGNRGRSTMLDDRYRKGSKGHLG
jgi:hypothetical protein